MAASELAGRFPTCLKALLPDGRQAGLICQGFTVLPDLLRFDVSANSSVQHPSVFNFRIPSGPTPRPAFELVPARDQVRMPERCRPLGCWASLPAPSESAFG